MMNSFSQSSNACQKAVQYLVAILMILIIGKLITMIPVMTRLKLVSPFKAAEVVWFMAKLSALVLFFYFSRATTSVITKSGGILTFFRDIATPLTILIIVIIGQELLWEMLKPFVRSTGKTAYYSFAIVLIVAISIWLVLRVYKSSVYLFDSKGELPDFISRFVPKIHKVCTACSEQIPGNAQFCSHCGHKAPEKKNCLECNEVLSINEKFCRHCGTAVEESSDATTP